MILKKIYLQPSRIVFKGMLDLMDSQNSSEIKNDCEQKMLIFEVMMFDMAWTLQFNAKTIDRTRCEVAMEIKEHAIGGEPWEELRSLADSVLRREYAMLDAMLLIGTPLEVTYKRPVG